MSLIPKKGTIYIVDDDEAVRDSLQWLLEGKDYRVRCFDSAETFLNRYDPKEVAVEAHRANIMEKLNANTVADLLKIALGPTGTKT